MTEPRLTEWEKHNLPPKVYFSGWCHCPECSTFKNRKFVKSKGCSVCARSGLVTSERFNRWIIARMNEKIVDRMEFQDRENARFDKKREVEQARKNFKKMTGRYPEEKRKKEECI